MFCEAHQCDDDQDRQTHRCQRQDLPALPARVETCTTQSSKQNYLILISMFYPHVFVSQRDKTDIEISHLEHVKSFTQLLYNFLLAH